MEDLELKKVQAIADTYRSQALFFFDSIANQMAHITELREKLANAEQRAAAPDRVAELEQIVKDKDAQIVEQSNTIVALRAQLNG